LFLNYVSVKFRTRWDRFGVLYSNKTKDDILLKDEIDELARINPDHLKLFHTLTRHVDEKDGEWLSLRGRIFAEMVIQCQFPEPSPETLILYCGPSPFNKTVLEILTTLGYTDDMIYKF
jgi:ferredoxin-NADP reductase